MKANELRIGNLINFSNKIQPDRTVKVDARFFSSLAGGRPHSEIKDDEEINDYYSGIPLTHEILAQNKFNIGGPECVGIVYEMIEYPGYWEYKGAKIQYVHQLQNLYPFFAPDEAELQFKINHDHNHSQL